MENLQPSNITLEFGILADEVIVIKYIVVIDENFSSTNAMVQSKIVYSVNEQVDLEEDSGTGTITIIDNQIVMAKTSNKKNCTKWRHYYLSVWNFQFG